MKVCSNRTGVKSEFRHPYEIYQKAKQDGFDFILTLKISETKGDI